MIQQFSSTNLFHMQIEMMRIQLNLQLTQRLLWMIVLAFTFEFKVKILLFAKSLILIQTTKIFEISNINRHNKYCIQTRNLLIILNIFSIQSIYIIYSWIRFFNLFSLTSHGIDGSFNDQFNDIPWSNDETSKYFQSILHIFHSSIKHLYINWIM